MSRELFLLLGHRTLKVCFSHLAVICHRKCLMPCPHPSTLPLHRPHRWGKSQEQNEHTPHSLRVSGLHFKDISSKSRGKIQEKNFFSTCIPLLPPVEISAQKTIIDWTADIRIRNFPLLTIDLQ